MSLVEATIDLDRDGAPARVVDGEGVIAIRATAEQAAEPYPAVDLIGATAITIAGASHAGHIVLGGALALPAVPGQLAQRVADEVDVALDADLPGALPPGPSYSDRTAEIRTLVASVQSRITPDLAATPASPREAPCQVCPPSVVNVLPLSCKPPSR
jgi:hypothetical protein